MTTSTPWRLAGKQSFPLGDASVWNATQAIRLFGVRVGIQTNRTALLERLEAHYPPLWQTAFTTVVDRVFSLRAKKSSYDLFENAELAIKTRSLRLALETFERQLKMYVAEMARQRVFVHAGAVGWQGKAIVIPGRSYSGKTTLVRELVRAGATYYSDEYAVLDMQGRLHPYPQPLAVRKEGSYVQRKQTVESLGGVTGHKPLPIGLVIVSKYREDARWRPLKLSAGQGMLEMLDNTVPARRKPAVVLPVLQKAVAAATILKGERSEAAEIVKRILETHL